MLHTLQVGIEKLESDCLYISLNSDLNTEIKRTLKIVQTSRLCLSPLSTSWPTASQSTVKAGRRLRTWSDKDSFSAGHCPPVFLNCSRSMSTIFWYIAAFRDAYAIWPVCGAVDKSNVVGYLRDTPVVGDSEIDFQTDDIFSNARIRQQNSSSRISTSSTQC